VVIRVFLFGLSNTRQIKLRLRAVGPSFSAAQALGTGNGLPVAGCNQFPVVRGITAVAVEEGRVGCARGFGKEPLQGRRRLAEPNNGQFLGQLLSQLLQGEVSTGLQFPAGQEQLGGQSPVQDAALLGQGLNPVLIFRVAA